MTRAPPSIPDFFGVFAFAFLWSSAAASMLLPFAASADEGGELAALGLSEVPKTPLDLRRAYHAAMLRAHPDTGGTDAAARAVGEANDKLKSRRGW